MSKAGAFIAIAAAVVIVGLLIAILQLAAPRRGPANPPSPTLHVTHPRGQWQDVATYQTGGSGIEFASSLPRAIRAWNGPHGLVLYALGGDILFGPSGAPGLSSQPGASSPWDGILTSTDGGQTWRKAPSSGIAWDHVGLAHVVGMLADGSLALALDNSRTPPEQSGTSYTGIDVTIAAWRQGDASWFHVTPPPGPAITSDAWVETASNGAQTIWIVYGENGAPTVTLRRCSLT